jgi:hypothetical protein
LSDSFRRLLCRFSVQVYDADHSAILCEAESDRLADAARPACYQCYLVVQTKPAHSSSTFVQPAKNMK